MSDSELNGNVTEGNTINCSKASSMEDLSEYTDADQSISAPTEILAEFLSSIMMKDYEKALKYCALILHYEPNNLTAREFYPLIEEKLEMMRREELEDSDSANSVECSSTSSSSSFENDSDDTTASYSSLEDDEAVENNDITNGNVNHIDTSISSNINEDNKTIGSEEETKVTETKPHKMVQNKTSPKKWVHSASPTIVKRDRSVDLTRTRTHPRRFQTNSDNKPSLNNPQLSMKSCKISDNNNSENFQRNKISD